MKALLPLLAASLAFPANAAVGAPRRPAALSTAELRDRALNDDKTAWDIVEGLTTEVGQRLAGTEAEARARAWAVPKLRALGFSNVHVEDYRMQTWVRGAESAEIVSPFPQKLVVGALGHSGATPPQGVTAEVVGFDSVDALRAAPDAAVRGKIVFVSHAMQPNQDGSGYGYYGAVRRSAPSIAASKGAAAVVIRSLGTDHHRNVHTGITSWQQGVTPIAAGALTIPDAENLERMLGRGHVTMHLVLTPRWIGETTSGNVVAEVPGSDPKAGIIVIGGHLDSWDLGTGAIDNAAGAAITAAAARQIMQAGARPRRTIRVVWFGSEEVGGFGSDAYFDAHKNENIVWVGESDFGADRVWSMKSNVADANKPLVDGVAAALYPLGINRSKDKAGGGADVQKFAASGVAIIDLQQDGTRYFDYHHTPDDTLDKIDPVQLRQNVAAWTAMLSLVANAPQQIEKAAAEVKQ